jgi:murein DD-endopeptidase MepM/ murein hydrolase activator NlpD
MRALPLAVLLLAAPPAAPAREVTKRVGSVSFRVDMRFAHQGGLMVAWLTARGTLGATYAILDGHRCPFFPAAGGLRALVPVSVSALPGATTLGIEIFGRRGRQRIPLDVVVEKRSYPSVAVVVPDDKLSLLSAPAAARDGRRLLAVLRRETREPWPGPFASPVTAALGAGFGSLTSYVGGRDVENLMDSLYGDHHRGLDYPVPVGTVIQSPAPGTVLLAEHLTLTGETLALDHGHGVVSVFYHLSRLDVRPGDRVSGRAAIALSGDTGVAAEPHLHWGVFVHGVAVDPQVFELLNE